MSNAPEILREAPPQVTMLTGDESAPDPATLAAISWLVRRYSSHAYIHRAHALLRGVHDAFLGWAGDAPMPNAILRFTAGKLAGALESFAAGLAALARGHRTTAHDHVLSAVAVHTTLTDARSDRGMSLDVMQQRLPPPAAAAAVRFCAMAVRIQHTLTATWTVETILGDRLGPRRLPDAPPPSSSTWLPALEQRTGAEVERTGIWIPTTIRNGCPNLLVAGHPRAAADPRRQAHHLPRVARQRRRARPRVLVRAEPHRGADHLAPRVARRTLPRRPHRPRARVPRRGQRDPGGPRVIGDLIVEVAHGPQRGQKAVVRPGQRLVVGSGADVDWSLADSGLAAQQLALEWDGVAGTLRHLGGDISTCLEGQAVDHGPVRHGTWIRAGGLDLTVACERHTPPEDSAERRDDLRRRPRAGPPDHRRRPALRDRRRLAQPADPRAPARVTGRRPLPVRRR
jgi:hypothetical protein